MRSCVKVWPPGGPQEQRWGCRISFSQLAEAYGKAWRVREGLSTLDEAIAVAQNNGEHSHEAELYRLKGQLTLQLGQLTDNSEHSQPRDTVPGSQSDTEAEACFRRAIEIARQQRAKSWELRATASLARLLAQQGHGDEARAMLGEIYGWFTEGFDTADLKEAKALIDELSR